MLYCSSYLRSRIFQYSPDMVELGTLWEVRGMIASPIASTNSEYKYHITQIIGMHVDNYDWPIGL